MAWVHVGRVARLQRLSPRRRPGQTHGTYAVRRTASVGEMMTILRARAKASERDVPEKRDESPQLGRDAFTVDRDRILQSKAFRRMRGKTQVFVSSLDDHVRTRLTHTLEVAQIARSLGRAAGLSETLLEAAAYGHDLGHTPFGHVGERTLHDICSGKVPVRIGSQKAELHLGGFKHSAQSLRLVTKLETHQTAWDPGDERFTWPLGLNLTKQTRWAMVTHTKIGFNSKDGSDVAFYCDELDAVRTGFSLEALALALADEIAQLHHDLVDGFLVGLLTEEDVHTALEPVLHAVSPDAAAAFRAQFAAAKDLFKRTGEKGRLGAVVSKHTANSLVTIGLGYVQTAMEKFESAFVEAGGTPGAYNIAADCVIWQRTLQNLGVQSTDWDAHPLGLPYGVLDTLATTSSGKKWVDPRNWQDECAVMLCDTTYRRVIRSEAARRMDGKAQFLVRRLVEAFLRTPELLPTRTLASVGLAVGLASDSSEDLAFQALDVLGKRIKGLPDVGRGERLEIRHGDPSGTGSAEIARFARVVVDHVAGMTDNYASAEHARLYDASFSIH